ncbi:hypothetical protein FOT46_24815 [Citrobacter freundii]|nr:hypothetical protein [Citrobacter freundii]
MRKDIHCWLQCTAPEWTQDGLLFRFFPDRAVDFIPYRSPAVGRSPWPFRHSIAGDKSDEWLQPTCNEMKCVLKTDALMNALRT